MSQGYKAVSEMSSKRACMGCGYEFGDFSDCEPCPLCGGVRRRVSVIKMMRERIELSEGSVFEAKRPGWKRFLRKVVDRAKRSRQGKKAREILDIDRTNPQKTTKYHHVEELTDGEWVTVHDHREEFDAKRRPLDEKG